MPASSGAPRPAGSAPAEGTDETSVRQQLHGHEERRLARNDHDAGVAADGARRGEIELDAVGRIVLPDLVEARAEGRATERRGDVGPACRLVTKLDVRLTAQSTLAGRTRASANMHTWDSFGLNGLSMTTVYRHACAGSGAAPLAVIEATDRSDRGGW